MSVSLRFGKSSSLGFRFAMFPAALEVFHESSGQRAKARHWLPTLSLPGKQQTSAIGLRGRLEGDVSAQRPSPQPTTRGRTSAEGRASDCQGRCSPEGEMGEDGSVRRSDPLDVLPKP